MPEAYDICGSAQALSCVGDRTHQYGSRAEHSLMGTRRYIPFGVLQDIS